MGSLYGNRPDTEKKTGPWWRDLTEHWDLTVALLLGVALAIAIVVFID